MVEVNYLTELDFYGLYLRRALQRVGNHAKADNVGFLKSRQKLANSAFEKAKKAGHCIYRCREFAFSALTDGLNLNVANSG